MLQFSRSLNLEWSEQGRRADMSGRKLDLTPTPLQGFTLEQKKTTFTFHLFFAFTQLLLTCKVSIITNSVSKAKVLRYLTVLLLLHVTFTVNVSFLLYSMLARSFTSTMPSLATPPLQFIHFIFPLDHEQWNVYIS